MEINYVTVTVCISFTVTKGTYVRTPENIRCLAGRPRRRCVIAGEEKCCSCAACPSLVRRWSAAMQPDAAAADAAAVNDDNLDDGDGGAGDICGK